MRPEAGATAAKGTDQVVTNTATGLRLLAIAAKHPSQLYVAGTLSLLAVGALAVSYAAIALLVTGRGWVVATVAACRYRQVAAFRRTRRQRTAGYRAAEVSESGFGRRAGNR